jgi:hypothetical protein
MRKAIAGLVLMLTGCDLQPSYILVMTTFAVNGVRQDRQSSSDSEVKRNASLLVINGATHWGMRHGVSSSAWSRSNEAQIPVNSSKTP